MPHSAAVLMSELNGVGTSPANLATNSGAINDAETLRSLGEAFGLSAEALDIASAADAFLPPAIVDAVLAGFHGAVTQATDGVFVSWRRSAGFSVLVAQDPGTNATSHMGVVSIQVASPPLNGPSQA